MPDLSLPVYGESHLAVYRDAEHCAPIVAVLVHGFGTAAWVWDPLVAHLLAADVQVRTVRYDQRGHGNSPLGSDPISMGLLADDLARVIEAAAPEGRVILVGHSMGGMTIMALARVRPDWFGRFGRIAGVLLSSTCGRTVHRGNRPPSAVGRFLRGLHAVSERITVQGRFALVVCYTLLLGTTSRAVADAYWRPLTRHDETRGLGRMAHTPVHILVGARDRITPVGAARDLAAHIPGASLHIARGGGHSLPEQYPDQVVGRLRDLLASMAPGRGAEQRRGKARDSWTGEKSPGLEDQPT
jgi:pimeloyl-ACP methyl ester carboxylesterase